MLKIMMAKMGLDVRGYLLNNGLIVGVLLPKSFIAAKSAKIYGLFVRLGLFLD